MPPEDSAAETEVTDTPESAPSAAPSATPRRGFDRLLRAKFFMSAVVFLVMAVLSVVSAVLLNRVVHSQERRLLNERVIELSSYLTASTAQSTTSLSALGDAVAVAGADSRLFQTLSSPLTHTATGAPSGATVAVVQRSAGSYRTVAATGTLAKVGQPLTVDQ